VRGAPTPPCRFQRLEIRPHRLAGGGELTDKQRIERRGERGFSVGRVTSPGESAVSKPWKFLGAGQMYTDQPKLLGQPEALASRLEEIDQPHIAPLTAFVRRLRASVGADAAIPFFDPWDGGINAEVLFLLEAPGPKARNSGFISRNNPDETAKNFFELLSEAGIPRKSSVLWNVVPWYIGTGTKIRPANTPDIASGLKSLEELLNLLPRLREIVLVGRKAQKAEDYIRKIRPLLIIEKSPHPSPMFINQKTGNREVLLNRLRRVKAHLEEVGSRTMEVEQYEK
jgi:uracil-DNA glycosylase